MVGEIKSARGIDLVPMDTIYMENRDLFICLERARKLFVSG